MFIRNLRGTSDRSSLVAIVAVAVISARRVVITVIVNRVIHSRRSRSRRAVVALSWRHCACYTTIDASGSETGCGIHRGVTNKAGTRFVYEGKGIAGET
jgi:hypothetical protein